MQTTDIVIDFTTGLSGRVAWPWPIAVYLFLDARRQSSDESCHHGGPRHHPFGYGVLSA